MEKASIVGDRWAVVLPTSSVEALARLRMVDGLEVCETAAELWLQGYWFDEALRSQLLGLSALERYTVDDEEKLTPWGQLTPRAELPGGRWVDLRKWMALSLPARVWPGAAPAKAPLRLVRGVREQPTGALLCDWDAWASYATQAPDVRLQGLAFVASRSRQAIIRGEELPPLRGQPLVNDALILVPAGWTWQPAVRAESLRHVLRLEEGEAALWLPNQPWQRIAGDAWVAATRSAVRQTAREAGYG